jgi:hypothetical protein
VGVPSGRESSGAVVKHGVEVRSIGGQPVLGLLQESHEVGSGAPTVEVVIAAPVTSWKIPKVHVEAGFYEH